MSNLVKKQLPTIAFIIGITLFVFTPALSAAYAVAGGVVLAGSQIRFILKNEGLMGLITPTKSMFKEMSSTESLPFKVGAAMFLSPLLALIVNRVLLHANS